MLLNNYIERLTDKAADRSLNFFDKTVLHTGLLSGIFICKFVYPEASKLLYHSVYGDGSDLELSAEYFRGSKYLKSKIRELGVGRHGPIPLKQYKDWRLSLVFNPYYLEIESNKVRIFHPRIEFAPVRGQKVATIIRIGKLKLRVYDNLVSALNPTPFYAYSEWEKNN